MQYNIPTIRVVPEHSTYGSSTIHEGEYNDEIASDDGSSTAGVAVPEGGPGDVRLQARSTLSETLSRPGDGMLPGYTFGNVGDAPAVLSHPHDGNPRMNPSGARRGGVREREPLGEGLLRVPSGAYAADHLVIDALEMAEMEMPRLPRPTSAAASMAARPSARPSDALREISAHLLHAASVEAGKSWCPPHANDVPLGEHMKHPMPSAAFVTIIGAPGPVSEANNPTSPIQRLPDRRHLVIPAGSQKATNPFQRSPAAPGPLASDLASRRIFGTAHCNPLACQGDGSDGEGEGQRMGAWLPLGSGDDDAQPPSQVGWKSLKDCFAVGGEVGLRVEGKGQPLGEGNEELASMNNKLLRSSGGGASDHQV